MLDLEAIHRKQKDLAELEAKLAAAKAELADAKKPKSLAEELAHLTKVVNRKSGQTCLKICNQPMFGGQFIIDIPATAADKKRLKDQFAQFIDLIDAGYLDIKLQEYNARQIKRKAREDKARSEDDPE